MPSQKIHFKKGRNNWKSSWSSSITLLLLLHIVIIVGATATIPGHLRRLLPSLDSVANIQELDREIQNYAFQSFGHSRTGDIYTVTLPSNLTGIKVEAIRLRAGSLRRRGLIFNEFSIPAGASVDDPNPVRLLLIYRQFTTLRIYTPYTYTLVAPVLGIKIYSASDLSTNASPELHLTSTGAPITVRIPFFGKAPATTLCASFDSNGSLSISNVTSPPNVCSFSHLGDFSLAIPSSAAAPAPQPGSSPFAAPSLSQPSSFPTGRGESKSRRNAWKIALGSALGAFALLVLAGVLVAMASRSLEKTRIAKMEHMSENGETLQTAPIGNHSRTPTAGGSRTRPSLENDYSL
ncbi:hypothetical protein O6H91_04G042800 [Diphasiastrum complanatum]|uniref:Uncharacterized protein n=4 Tax=Diphasiastrum complanatum TaxID=34168 RepID=A0ACC2DW83_DIPCM|nr:hypothetical protein O6H91_04G041500 [Diphasiastrum complanatum]KAJ7558479.1 hypothetical protein O6H91_04G041500 [Diphasiastrum complanatum]KAJ7558498.1 hypothetical protein O6H91_04G042800 [Diphasiastrum complanatum]KAJ7558499.1 hypothetical protein O6H91_04G042800 [Diphasiastrum complanatum]